jgi:hypothetical protein
MHPNTFILDWSTTYHYGSQNMKVFLKDRKMWQHVSNFIPKLVPKPQPPLTVATTAIAPALDDDFEACHNEWVSMHCKTLSWFINTSTPSIKSLVT